jgi:diguanylate cyclase (GGDEF)-like protein
MATNRLIFSIAVLSTLLVGYYDHKTGAHISMMLLYSVPVLVSARYCGRAEGIIAAVLATSCWLVVNVINRSPEESDAILSWNALTRLGIFVLIAYSASLQAKLRLALEREKLMARTDGLTGLYNIAAFREQVEAEIKRARRYNHPLSLAFIYLDNFKEVNDTEGHARGDTLLQHVSESISNAIRKTDIAGRVGGDEFTICFPAADGESVHHAINKLVKALDIMTSQSGWQVTASIGVVTCTQPYDTTYDALLEKADKLMYAAKDKGKNTAQFAQIGTGWHP